MNLKSWDTVGFCLSLFLLEVSSYTKFDITVPSAAQIALHGHTVVLRCSFPVGNAWDLGSSAITWQRGLEVVHSFYHGRDQLDLQSRRYAHRTSLYHSEMKRGNASLRLDSTTVEDVGEYTCSVSTQMGSQQKSFLLRIAAFYSEPRLQFTTSGRGVELLLTSEGGYPSPTLQWLNGSMEYVTNSTETNVTQDTNTGLYTVSSNLTLQGGDNSTLTFILKNEDLKQQIRREINIISKHGGIPLEMGKHTERSWVPTILLAIVGLVVLVPLATVYFRRHKTRLNKDNKNECVYQRTPESSTVSIHDIKTDQKFTEKEHHPLDGLTFTDESSPVAHANHKG